MPPSANVAWGALVVAGLFEVGFTTCLRLNDNWRNIPWSIGFGVCAAISFSMLSYATRTIPLGTGYAVWTGIGAVGTLAVGLFFFGEPAGTLRVLLVLGIIACVVGLKLAH